MIKSFKQKALKDYWLEGKWSKKLPAEAGDRVLDKLDLINAATSEAELRCPPGNRFEHLSGNLKGWCSIRVTKQWRLVFKWDNGEATQVYLDPHEYR